MAKFVIHIIILFYLAGVSANSELVPLEVFAKHPSFTDMEISPKGNYIAFTYEEGTEVKLAVMKRDSKKIVSSFAFGENRHVTSFEWLNDERIGMFVQTVIGWLDGTNPKTRWVAANADGSKRITLGYFERSALSLISKLEKDKKHVLVSKRHWSEKGRIKLNKLNIYTGKLKYLADAPAAARHSEPGIVNLAVDLHEKVRFAYEFDIGEDEVDDSDDKGYFHFKDKNDIWQRLDLPNKRKKRPNFTFFGMSADNQKAYFSSNYDMQSSDTLGLFEFDLNTQSVSLLYRHDDVDVTGGIYGTQRQLIGVYLEPGYPTIHYIENSDNEKDITMSKSLGASFKNQFTSIISRTKNNRLSVVSVRSGRNPGDFYLFDAKNKSLSYISSTKSEVDPKLMSKVEPFTLIARDGLKLYGFLTIPNNVKLENLPLVVYPHGGPYGVKDRWRWDRRAQMLASRGYLVLQLNFRGSGGYGQDFQDAGSTQWGLKMQDDLTDATHWAINSGIADKNKICIHGVSYGGYASMNAVVKEPDLYKCSIPDAGVYEMALQWDKADSFRGRNGSKRKKSYMKYTIGGYDNVVERSPVYHVDKLKADLLIVHGAADVRVPIENAYILEEKLKEAGHSYEKMYKEEEGHGFQQFENRVELYQEILDFLDKHIGPNAR